MLNEPTTVHSDPRSTMWSPTSRFLNEEATFLPTISSRTAGRYMRPLMILKLGSFSSHSADSPRKPVLAVPPSDFLVTSMITVACGSNMGLPSGPFLIPGASPITAACSRVIEPM